MKRADWHEDFLKFYKQFKDSIVVGECDVIMPDGNPGKLPGERFTSLLYENVDRLLKEVDMFVEMAEKYQYCRQGCHPKHGDHDDPSWCNEMCMDYGKKARTCLEKYRNGEV